MLTGNEQLYVSQGEGRATVKSKEVAQLATAVTTSIAQISTANATDEATAVTLVNECKAKINAILAAFSGA